MTLASHRPAQAPTSREPAVRLRPTAAGNAAAPPALAAPPNALALLQALKRRWRLALLVGPGSAVLVAVLVYLFVPSSKYTARVQLQIASQGTKMLDKNSELPLLTYQQNQMTLIKSRVVLKTALEQPQVASLATIRQQANPIEWLDRELDVEATPGAETLRIFLNGDHPEDLPIILKAVTDAYLRLIVNREQLERTAQRDRLQKIWDTYDHSLADKRAEVKNLADEAGGKDSAVLIQKQRFAQESLNTYQKELLKSQSELRSAEIELKSLKAREQVREDVPVADYQIEQVLRTDPIVQGYYRDIARLQEEMKVTEKRFQPGRAGPYVREYQKQIDEIQALLAGYRDRVRPSVEAEARGKAQLEQRARLAELQEKVNNLSDLEKGLQAQVDHLTEQTHTIQKSSADLESKMSAIGKEESIAKRIGDQVETLNVELQAPSRVTLLEEAVVTRSRDEKKPLKMAGMAGIGAMGLGLFGISWWEFLARRVHNVDDVAQGLGLRVLGTLPVAPAAVRRLGCTLPADRYRHALLTEAADATRSALVHAARAENARSILVTSAVAAEGKTALAAHLAASLARAGLRTLLIDGDLRNPSAHGVFEMAAGPGLSEVLRGEIDAARAIQQTPTEGLWLLSAGQADGRAVQALMSDRVGPVLDGLKARYDFVVLDACPVLPVGDALSLGQHVDAVVLAVLRDVSNLRKVHQACQRLTQFGIRILGVGLSGMHDEVYGKAYQVAGEVKLA